MSIETAIFGGGCFWCLDSVFRRVRGVKSSLCGYMGGDILNPSYEQICTGKTGHAEVVKLSFDNEIINSQTLLKVYFSIHDPTSLNRQGHDIGTQYRSIIFYQNPEQLQAAELMIQEIENSGTYKKAIVTAVQADEPFYEAESYHQNYFNNNPGNGYCQATIPPKLIKVTEYFET